MSKRKSTKRATPPSGKGQCPKGAAYTTQTDHRAQVERAEKRLAKKKIVKERRKLDDELCNDDKESLPKDILSMDHQNELNKAYTSPSQRR